MKYVNLHTHDTFSVFDGIGYPADFIDFVIKNSGEDSMGLGFSNHGNANNYGYLYSYQKKLEQKGIPFKCIYGCEFYYIDSIDNWKKLKEDKEEKEESISFENEEESKNIKKSLKDYLEKNINQKCHYF